MLDYNEIKPRTYIVLDGEPYEVINSWVVKKNRGKPTNQTKIKSLVSGKVAEKTFHASDRVQEADIETRDIKYLYTKQDEIWFCEPDNPRERFMLDAQLVGDRLKFIKENDIIKSIYFDDRIIDIKLPMKVELRVTVSPDAVKGNTSSGALKRVTVENSLEVMVPLFIKENDIIVVGTDKGDYSERKSL